MSATWREQDGPWRHCRRRSESLARAGVARHHRLSRHPRFYPHVAAADVVEMDERRAIVHYRVTVGPLSFGFYMEKYPDPRRRRVEWHLAEGRPHGPFRENSGYWQINSTDDGAASLVLRDCRGHHASRVSHRRRREREPRRDNDGATEARGGATLTR